MTAPLLIIINRLSVGGAERLVVDELNELYRRGIEAHIVTLYPEGRSSLLQELDIPKQYIHTNVRFFALFGLMHTFKPQAVICHLWYANTAGRIAAKLAGIKNVIVFEHNVYDRVKSRRQFLLDKLLQGWTRKIVAVSEPVKKSLVVHGIHAERVVVLHNAIDTTRYESVTPANLKQEFNLPSDAIVLLAVGRLTKQKGFDVLIKAVPSLPDTAHVVLFGIGEEEKALKELAHTLIVQHRVHFGAVRQDIPAVLKAAKCLVMPSRWEGEPIILLEALAAGVPVVGSDIAPLRALVTENVNGFLVQEENPKALAGAILRVIGTDVITLSFPPDRTIAHHVDVLLEIVG